MHRVDFSTNVPVLELYNPRDRQRVAPGFTWSYLVRTAANIASVVEAVHACGYVIGDLNESNFLVSDQALVTLVDCDSIQVPKPDRAGFFRCTVGKPEFTPPELQGMDFSQTDRDSTHDNFALGVMIFQLLMEGVHPYAGVWHGAGEPPPLEDRIRAGDSPYAGSTRTTPMPAAVSFEILPVSLRSLILRCFGDGQHNPSSRPAAREWGEALGILDRNLNTCSVNERHVFSNHLPGCPWCERSLLLQGFDSFPQTIQQQPADTTAFTVLKAIEAERPTVKAIVRHVLSLSKDAQDDLERLLESTSLTAIIEATTSVAKRLELLKALEHLVSDYKATLRERSELHRILAENTWVFGEQFHRTVDDESLNVVLERHLSFLGRHSLGSTEVRREDGTRGIVDLMLSRRVAFPRAEEREHLVIELKRPNQKIDHNVLNQIESYATAVARDDRFREGTVRWTFVAISNELSESVKEKASQRDRPPGCVFISGV
jgi:serine/threonine protein kinase